MLSPHLLFLLLFFPSFTFSDRCHQNDKNTLLQIKKDLNNSNNFVSWDPDIDCCKWHGVECNDNTNHVVVLSVLIANLSVVIPESVSGLSHLEELVFHKTNLVGEIPRSIARLSRLRFLDLTWNCLTGPVPSFLSQLRELTYIGLSFNNLTGSIPSSLSQLPKLSGLLLDRNRLTGNLPESFGDFQSELFYLYLSHNDLTGLIPRKWGDANFTYIDLSRNKLEGDISFLFGKNKSLDYADFSRNKLRFDMTNLEFSSRLGTLNLNHNMIYGSLPKGLAESNRVHLNVSYNRLCGEIPMGGLMQEMGYTSYFHNKCLCGAPLPPCKRT